jgi:hypothetical protein
MRVWITLAVALAGAYAARRGFHLLVHHVITEDDPQPWD